MATLGGYGKLGVSSSIVGHNLYPASSGALEVASSMQFDQARHAWNQTVDIQLRKELMEKFEHEFMSLMEKRIWKRIESMKTLQNKYDDIIKGPGNMAIGKSAGYNIELEHEFWREHKDSNKCDHADLGRKMQEAMKKTVFCPPKKKSKPPRRNGTLYYSEYDPLERWFEKHVYNTKLSPVDNLWEETDEWLKNIKLATP